MERPSAVNLYVRRGTKGRIVGWLVFCEEDGTVDEPQNTKKKAETIANDHARTAHMGNARVHIPVR